MKFKVKNLYTATGSTFVAILHAKDARVLDLHSADRVGVNCGRKKTVAVLDITNTLVKPGEVGLFKEVIDKIGVRTGSHVKVCLEEKPHSVSLIKRKLNGKKLSEEDMYTIVNDIVKNRLTDIELTYFVAAGYVRAFDLEETVSLTKAMINTGEVLRPKYYPVIDKHCIGGVPGNRTTMLVVPILIAAGYCVPKTSSRSITSPAGTADTMEVLTDVNLPIQKIKKVVDRIGGCMTWGGSVNLAPADDKIIAVEHPLSVDAEGQLLASILAKKGSVSSTHVIIDIPVGKTAKIHRMDKAKHLKKQFEKVGRKIGMKIKVVITDGSQPIGNGIGPALEARDVLWVLQNHEKAPQDLIHKSLMVAAEVFKAFPLKKWHTKKGYNYAKELLESGQAWEVFRKIIIAQGKKVTDPKKVKIGKYEFDVKATKSGKIKEIDNIVVSKMAKAAGAPVDPGAGIYLMKKVGDKVTKNEILFTVYAENKQHLGFAKDYLKYYEPILIS